MYTVLIALISLAAAILIIINSKMKSDIVEKEIRRADKDDRSKRDDKQL